MQVILLEKSRQSRPARRGRQGAGRFRAQLSDSARQGEARDAGEHRRVRKRRVELEKAQAEALAQAQERAAKLDGLMVQVTQKAGVDGKLFGSVTNVDISEALKAQGFDVPKAAIRMPQGPLKQVGDHPLKIALHTDVVVTVTVSVLGEQ